MTRATWNGQVLAESDKTVIVEGNHYFPKSSLNMAFFEQNSRKSSCPWKGVASYFDITVDGKTNRGAAWIYPTPKAAASNIKDHVAFWNGVMVQ
ncbi:MAG: DUF427 domain-containing protein [Candidatus Promineifilaceae bacterium]